MATSQPTIWGRPRLRTRAQARPDAPPHASVAGSVGTWASSSGAGGSIRALYFLYGRGDADDSSDAGMTLGPGYCAFSGEVLDLYRLDPVKNAQLMLKPKGYARSDKAGRYYVKVKAGIPYHFTIAQPQFKPAFIEGSWRDAAFEQRVRASRLLEKADSDPSDKPYECSSGEERSLVLGLVPKAVTADEKKDIDAVP